MNNVRKFNVNSPSNLSMRAFIENGEPWFCSADVCRAFGIMALRVILYPTVQ